MANEKRPDPPPRHPDDHKLKEGKAWDRPTPPKPDPQDRKPPPPPPASKKP